MLDIHFHGLFLDGVYTGFETRQPLRFQPANRLSDDDVASQVRHMAVLITSHLRRRGYLDEDLNLIDESGEELGEQATHQAAAVQGLIPFGPQAGCQALLFGEELRTPPAARTKKKLCADTAGYSLHAAIRVGESARGRLEKLARYLARPCLSQDRLSIAKNGHIVYRFRKAWRNGKTAVVLDPMTFLHHRSSKGQARCARRPGRALTAPAMCGLSCHAKPRGGIGIPPRAFT